MDNFTAENINVYKITNETTNFLFFMLLIDFNSDIKKKVNYKSETSIDDTKLFMIKTEISESNDHSDL